MARRVTVREISLGLFSIVALVWAALPSFISLQVDAKNTATQGAVVGVRSSLAVAAAAIALREAASTPRYPTLNEVRTNLFDSSHPILFGTTLLEGARGIPKNPWTIETAEPAETSAVFSCDSDHALADRGWCYRPLTGQFWANSTRNGGGVGATENYY